MKYRLFLSSLAVVFALALMGLATTSAKAQTLNTFVTYEITETYNLDANQIWNLVSDLRNEEDYWPQIDEAVITHFGSDSDPASPGTVYLHSGTFGGFPFANEITIVASQAPYYMAYEARSLYVGGLEYIGTVGARPRAGGGGYRIDSSLFKSAGVTVEDFLAFQAFGIGYNWVNIFAGGQGQMLVNWAADVTPQVGEQTITWDLVDVDWDHYYDNGNSVAKAKDALNLILEYYDYDVPLPWVTRS